MTTHGWFDVSTIGPGVTMIAEPGHEEDVKSYLIEGSRDVAVLDTGMGVGDFRGLVDSLSDRNPVVLQSHAHWDHIGDSSRFERVYVHPAEETHLAETYPNEDLRPWFSSEKLRGIPFPDEFDLNTASIAGTRAAGYLNHGDRIDLGDRTVEIYHTPGHSPGGISILDRSARLLFPGDAVNIGPIYLFSVQQADLKAYRNTIALLAELSAEVDLIYPSHYQVPMNPEQVVAVRDAFEEVLDGRQPDAVLTDREVFDYGWFVFWIAPGARQQFQRED